MVKTMKRRDFLRAAVTTAAGIYLVGPAAALAAKPRTRSPYIAYDFSSDSDKTLLARMIYGESAGEIASKEDPDSREAIMIGHVAMNRVGTWQGKTLKDVILKNGPVKIKVDEEEKIKTDENGIPILYHQFSCFNAWDVNLQKIKKPWLDSPEKWEQANLIARRILKGKLTHLNDCQDHYHTKKVSPRWSKSSRMRKVWGQEYFKHNFYEDMGAQA